MEPQPFWPLGLWFLAVLGTLASVLALSFVLGERHREPATLEPYESGMLPTGDARVRLSPGFYLVAMLFVIFDLEAVFLFAWAIAAREVGWPGYVEMVVFVTLLLVALGWIWRVGALDWARTTRHVR